MNSNSTVDLAVPVTALDHRLGPIDASAIIVEYGDFECPNCKQAAPAVKLMRERFANRICFVYRHFPLEEVHPHALQAALAAEAAGAQGRFWHMHELLFEHQPHLTPPQLRGYARELALDMARFDADMSSSVYVQRVRDQADGARRSGARGTPSFFVDGRIHDVSFGLHSLIDAIDARLACAPGGHSD